ncbi:MAG: phosphotransferase, partial [Lentisphaeria bacterium]|nr:phosphotransferase [Lentisphaeria bacterium]
FHQEHEADVSVLLIPNNRKNGVEVDGEGRIVSYHSPKGTLTFSGLYIFKRDILDYLPADEEAPSILTAFQRAAEDGRVVLGVIGEEGRFWSDVGTPREYIRAHGEIADCGLTGQPMLHAAVLEQSRRRFVLEQKQGVRCTGAVGLGRDVRVAPGSHLHNVVLWDGTDLSVPGLYADGIICGGKCEAPCAPNAQERVPDERVFKTLDMNPAEISFEEPLKQGSGRRYSRLKSSTDGRSVIWSAYSLARRENSAFAPVADFLRGLGIPVANTLLHLPDVGEVVLEDLGGADLLQTSSEERWRLLDQVLRQAAHFHVHGAKAARLSAVPLQPTFTPGYYDWERDYFRKNLLQDVLGRIDLWDDAVACECREIRRCLLEAPLIPIHRDFQSANIKVRDGKCFWIDFQGMRLGAAVYDMASLLYDPYVEYTPEQRRDAWRRYCTYVREEGGTPSDEALFHTAAIQRLMQALGAYGKLWRQDGLVWYRKYILPALRHLRQAALASGLAGFQHLAEEALGILLSHIELQERKEF